MDPAKDQTEESSAEVEELAQDGAGEEPVADSSTASDEKGEDLESIVSKALGSEITDDEGIEDEGDGEPAGESSAPGEGEAESEAEEAAEQSEQPESETGEVTNDDLLKMLDQLRDEKAPLHKIERFKEVISENKRLSEDNEALRQYQEHVSNIAHAAQRMGIESEDMAKFMSWPMQLAQDPESAIGFLREFTSRWESQLGHQLPDDLRQKVEEGYLDEETASELARLRASKGLTQRQLDAERQNREAEQAKEHRRGIAQAVDDWQAQIKARDPDYTEAKHGFVRTELKAIVADRGLPKDKETALKWAKEAYDTVTSRMGATRPTPRAVRQTPGRPAQSPSKAPPESMAEAIQRALTGG